MSNTGVNIVEKGLETTGNSLLFSQDRLRIEDQLSCELSTESLNVLDSSVDGGAQKGEKANVAKSSVHSLLRQTGAVTWTRKEQG